MPIDFSGQSPYGDYNPYLPDEKTLPALRSGGDRVENPDNPYLSDLLKTQASLQAAVTGNFLFPQLGIRFDSAQSDSPKSELLKLLIETLQSRQNTAEDEADDESTSNNPMAMMMMFLWARLKKRLQS